MVIASNVSYYLTKIEWIGVESLRLKVGKNPSTFSFRSFLFCHGATFAPPRLQLDISTIGYTLQMIKYDNTVTQNPLAFYCSVPWDWDHSYWFYARKILYKHIILSITRWTEKLSIKKNNVRSWIITLRYVVYSNFWRCQSIQCDHE